MNNRAGRPGESETAPGPAFDIRSLGKAWLLPWFGATGRGLEMRIARVTVVAAVIVLLAGCGAVSDRINAYQELQELREKYSELEEQAAQLEEENESLRSELKEYRESFRDMYR